MKIQMIVMPARIADIQAHKDASGNIHVNLDFRAPCWNDGESGVLESPKSGKGFLYNSRSAMNAARSPTRQL
jgi:hypothetical protein